MRINGLVTMTGAPEEKGSIADRGEAIVSRLRARWSPCDGRGRSPPWPCPRAELCWRIRCYSPLVSRLAAEEVAFAPSGAAEASPPAGGLCSRTASTERWQPPNPPTRTRARASSWHLRFPEVHTRVRLSFAHERDHDPAAGRRTGHLRAGDRALSRSVRAAARHRARALPGSQRAALQWRGPLARDAQVEGPARSGLPRRHEQVARRAGADRVGPPQATRLGRAGAVARRERAVAGGSSRVVPECARARVSRPCPAANPEVRVHPGPRARRASAQDARLGSGARAAVTRRSFTSRLDDWMFRSHPVDPQSLALYRVLYAGFLLFSAMPDASWLVGLPDALFDPPPGPFRLFHGFPSAVCLQGMMLVLSLY